MRICIIGSSGYIGSFLTKHLMKKYYVCGIDIIENSYTHYNINARHLQQNTIEGFDIIIYLAGLSGRLQCISASANDVIQNNITDVIDFAKKLNNKQLFIYASTAGILEGSHEIPASETWIVQEDILDSYTKSMYQREKAIATLTNTNTIGLRFGTVIGTSPKQRFDLVHIAMMKAAYQHCQFEVANPYCHRAILFIWDLYNIIVKLIESYKDFTNLLQDNHHVFNLASYNTRIIDVANDIQDITSIKYSITKDEGISGFSLDCSKIKNTLSLQDYMTKSQKFVIQHLKDNIGHICGGEWMLKCRVCSSKNLEEIINLGYQPLANNYLDDTDEQDKYKLCVLRCLDCHHTGLDFNVAPVVLFRNYQYVSGTTKTLCEYFAYLAKKINNDILVARKKVVLEIACNDGSQLDEFKKLGWETWGVDPALNIVSNVSSKGHNIMCGFWGVDKFQDKIADTEFDVIVAQNVLAHVPNPINFLCACADVMSRNTLLYIQTSQCNMYMNGEFDTIYHEHASYFTVNSMKKATELAGLGILEVTKENIHGVSYLFKIKKAISTGYLPLLHEEYQYGMYSSEFYRYYKSMVNNTMKWTKEQLENMKQNNIDVIGFGCPAKAVVMLNYFNIDNEYIKYICDDATMKHNKYVPGKKIKIFPCDKLYLEYGKGDKPVCIWVLAWNFYDEIISKIRGNFEDIGNVTVMRIFPRVVQQSLT